MRTVLHAGLVLRVRRMIVPRRVRPGRGCGAAGKLPTRVRLLRVFGIARLHRRLGRVPVVIMRRTLSRRHPRFLPIQCVQTRRPPGHRNGSSSMKEARMRDPHHRCRTSGRLAPGEPRRAVQLGRCARSAGLWTARPSSAHGRRRAQSTAGPAPCQAAVVQPRREYEVSPVPMVQKSRPQMKPRLCQRPRDASMCITRVPRTNVLCQNSSAIDWQRILTGTAFDP